MVVDEVMMVEDEEDEEDEEEDGGGEKSSINSTNSYSLSFAPLGINEHGRSMDGTWTGHGYLMVVAPLRISNVRPVLQVSLKNSSNSDSSKVSLPFESRMKKVIMRPLRRCWRSLWKLASCRVVKDPSNTPMTRDIIMN